MLLKSSMLINMLINMLLMSGMLINMLINMLLMSSMLINMLLNMLLMSDSSPTRLLISWFELVHPIHCSADRIFRWVDEKLLMEKHDSYSMFTCLP